MNNEISQAVLEGNIYDIEDILQKQLAADVEPMACVEAMMAGLDETGKRFEQGVYFLPELVVAADVFKTGMDVLTPLLAGKDREYRGTVVLGTVRGDVHDIGKNLVGFMLESNGFRVIDLGTDVDPKLFVNAVRTHSADVLALSALLTTTMLGMKTVIDELEMAGLRSSVKVIVGGAPLSRKFTEEIRADAYGPTAPDALEIVKGWLCTDAR
jgi:5-methyltetrahydrofolate--homocysteine methyltransferase